MIGNGNAESLRRLYVSISRSSATPPQQPAQSGQLVTPRSSKDQQLGVGSLLHGLEEFGVLVHENLQHQTEAAMRRCREWNERV